MGADFGTGDRPRRRADRMDRALHGRCLNHRAPRANIDDAPLTHKGDAISDAVYNRHVVKDERQVQAFPRFHTLRTDCHLVNTLCV